MLILAFLWILYLAFKCSVILAVKNQTGGTLAENQAAYEDRPVAEVRKDYRESLVCFAIAAFVVLIAWLFRWFG